MTRRETMADASERDALIGLAERCEAATGPEWELDAEIAFKMGWRKSQGHWWTQEQSLAARKAKCAIWATGMPSVLPAFTKSIDAAMTLVPEGWQLRQMAFSGPCADDRKWHLNIYGGSVGRDILVGRGATPALALTAAALRARATAIGEKGR